MSDQDKLQQKLIARAESVRAGAEVLAEVTRDVQILEQYISNRLDPDEMKLTAKQEEKLKIYQFIYDQMAAGKPTATIVAQLTNKNLYKRSQSQAYEDIRCSKELFVSVIQVNKRFELNNEIEINKIYRNKAAESNDFRAVERLSKVIKDLYAMLPDEDQVAGEDFQPHIIDATFNPLWLGAPDLPDMNEVLRVINEKRNVKIKIDMFQEIEFINMQNGDSTKTL